MKKHVAIITIAAAVLAVMLLAWGLLITPTTHRDAASGKPVTISIAGGLPAIIPIIAREKHFFEQEGLNVRYTDYYASGKDTFDAMLAGEADISGPATIPVVLNSFERNDYSIFLTYTVTYRGVKIIARRDRGILRAEDLKGKRIGNAKGTISHMTLESLISFRKILNREIIMSDIVPSLLPEAVISGSVDAIAIWEPLATQALTGLGDKGLEIPTDNVYRIAINLAVKKAFIAGNKDSLVKIVRAMDRAISFVRDHRTDSQKIIANILDLDLKTISATWTDYTHAITLDQELIITMENEAEWAIQSSLTNKKEVPNYLGYIYTGALEEYMPGAITLIR